MCHIGYRGSLTIIHLAQIQKVICVLGYDGALVVGVDNERLPESMCYLYG